MEVAAVPSVTLVWDSVQVKPVEGDMFGVRATVPVKP
jgi:hypothetical protein